MIIYYLIATSIKWSYTTQNASNNEVVAELYKYRGTASIATKVHP